MHLNFFFDKKFLFLNSIQKIYHLVGIILKYNTQNTDYYFFFI